VAGTGTADTSGPAVVWVTVVVLPFTMDVDVPVAEPPPVALVVTEVPEELEELDVAVTNAEDELELDVLTGAWVTPQQTSLLRPRYARFWLI